MLEAERIARTTRGRERLGDTEAHEGLPAPPGITTVARVLSSRRKAVTARDAAALYLRFLRVSRRKRRHRSRRCHYFSGDLRGKCSTCPLKTPCLIEALEVRDGAS